MILIKTLEERLDSLGEFIAVLAEQSKARWEWHENEKRIATAIVGMPYYWGDYSGVVKAHPSKPTHVVTHLVNQKNGHDCQWIFEAGRTLEHLRTIESFENWEAYHRSQMLNFAEDYESMMIRFQFTKERIMEEMQKWCQKSQTPYKHYLQEA